MNTRWGAALLLACFLTLAVAAEPVSMVATGSGRAWASFASRGVEATLEGALEFSFLGLAFQGFGNGQGILELRTFSGWGWAVVWGRSTEIGETGAEIVGGLAVEGSPALGSGSVTGTCAFIVRQNGARREYRGTFVTQAKSRLVPAERPGTLALEGEIAIAFTLTPCASDAPPPWDSTRWPAELWSEFEGRFVP